MDSELAITMQEWESGITIESTMTMPNHCSATEKKQEQLLGITGNRAQGWKHYASILTPSVREQEGKGEIKTTTFMKGNWTQRHCLQLRKPQSYELLETKRVFWEAIALLLHLSAISQRWRQGIGKKDLCPDLAVFIASYLLSLFRAGALKITLQLWIKTIDSNDSLADPSQRPLKPEGTHRKWV